MTKLIIVVIVVLMSLATLFAVVAMSGLIGGYSEKVYDALAHY